ncbi:MAG TPA: hypothetical protein PLY93_12595 [Turneriella sp.]|nr:hypothetical protein [Turneriella sp.]
MTRYITILSFLIFPSWIMGVVPMLDMVNTPTAQTLKRGEFNVALTAYEGGGIFNRNMIGIHDNIYLGAAFDVENAIGYNTAKMNIPGVIAKAKLTDGWADFPILLAVGYDAFYASRYGKVNTGNPYNRMIFGPYFSITKPIYLLGDEQHIHFGTRMPVYPNYTPEDTELYIGIDFPMGMFIPIFEIQRILFDANRFKEILFNLGFRFQFFDHLAFEIDFMMGIDQRTNRMLVFEYMDRF